MNMQMNNNSNPFPATAPVANPVFYRTYSRRKDDGLRETWEEVCDRTISGLAKLGKLTADEVALLRDQQISLKSLPSGRWLWVGGTEWIEKPENFPGSYNCSSTSIVDWKAFGLMMDLAMQGCGTGAILEDRFISKLPIIRNKIEIELRGEPGLTPADCRKDDTSIDTSEAMRSYVIITVGDSRKGWVDAYQAVLEASFDEKFNGQVKIIIELSNIRPEGEKLKGFGGVANPRKLPGMFPRIAEILNGAVGRKLNSVECCLLIDEAALVVVAGSIRRSAGLRQANSHDAQFAVAKDNLWVQEDGNWKIDPKRDALRMANHTRVFHSRPSIEDCKAAVTKQFFSGEGAIQYAPEAIARANADLLNTPDKKQRFIEWYVQNPKMAEQYLINLAIKSGVEVDTENFEHRLTRYGLNPCLTGDTKILTFDGVKTFAELAETEEDVLVWCINLESNQRELSTMRRPHKTRFNTPIVEIEFDSGLKVKATPDHNFFTTHHNKVKAKDLRPGMSVLAFAVNEHEERLDVNYKVVSVIPAGKADVYNGMVEQYHNYIVVDDNPVDKSFLSGIVSANCGEIILVDNFCDLAEIHLNQIDPLDFHAQKKAFQTGAIAVAALLNHQFVEPRYQRSRELDPIVGVSFTGLFDFFVQVFGAEWLRWWEAGRPNNWYQDHDGNDLSNYYRKTEQEYLSRWRDIVTKAVWDYCDRHNLKRPNRCTTVQPAGCLDKNALRVFDQGLLYADEIVSPGSGETKGIDLSVRGGIAASTAIANNPLNLVCVELKNGRILRMTPNHKLMIGTKWIEACDMKPGMEIEYKLGTYKKEEDALLVNIHASEYTREYRSKVVGHCRGVLSKSIKVPTTLNPDLAYFIGAMFGNGCLSKSKSRIRFCHSSLQILGRLSKIGEKLFGMTGTINGDPGGNKHELVFASVQLFDWFVKNNIGKPSKSVDLDRIPEPVRRSSKSSILAFFAGLIDTDGCPRNGSFSIDMASEKFIRNLQQVGEAVGLGFSVSNNTKGSNFQKEKSIWTLSLSRMTSDKNTIADLNALSTKLFYRPIQNPKCQFKYKPYSIKSVTLETTQDYSYDFAVEGKDYDDSWYWQGGLKSHNTKSLLTGASSGWHPPKAQRFIRRVTFRKYDPVAMACIDFGYSVVPSQSDKDENGVLLNNPFDDRCTEWLVEIPVEVPWANLPGADTVDLSQFSALAQFDFYMQVQKHYTAHNCFARNTEFLTDKGIKTFEDFNVGDTVKVLNANGDWVDSSVVNTGTHRTMYEITLRQGSTGKIKKITATGCHRFPVRRISGGYSKVSIKTTLELKPGHRFVTNTPDLIDLSKDAIRHGLIFGDGSKYKNQQEHYIASQLYLCNGKRELTSFFMDEERLYERDDINQTRIYGLPLRCKELPSEDCSQEYFAGFLAGLFATDGNVHESCLSLSTSREDVVAFIAKHCPRIGISVTSIQWYESSGYKGGSGAYQILFSKETFPENMVIRSFHQMHLDSKGKQPRQWRVVSVEELPEPQVGWCVMEPETNHFTLSQNILVMNTSATIELRQHEIEPLAERIYQAIQNDEGYISAALLARFDDRETYPRLPFEPISKEQYEKLQAEVLSRRETDDFNALLARYDQGEMIEAGPAGCDSDKCLFSDPSKK